MKTKIVAPFDCTILTRPVSVGQAVSGASGVNSGTEVLTIADLSELIINAHINQADVTRMTVNQKVEIEVEAVAGPQAPGAARPHRAAGDDQATASRDFPRASS